MSSYSVEFTTPAKRELKKLPKPARDAFVTKIKALQADPRPIGAIKMKGFTSVWRIRVGTHRVIYEINDGLVLVTVIRASFIRWKR